MVKRIVNVLFALLAICTLVLGLFVLSVECAADGFFVVVALIYGPVVLAIVFGSEYFWWRSVLFLVSYTDEKPVVIGASIVNVILSSVTLVYMTYGAFHKVGLPVSFVLYAFVAQLVCRLLIWIRKYG